MKNVRWFPVLAILFVCLPAFAQKEDEAARERQRKMMTLADSLIADARQLTLPENRAVVLANVGARIWETDQKRAQGLFADSISELLAAQADAEAERRKDRPNEVLTGQSTRPSILRVMAGRNAGFALDSFYRTRPAAIERAMLGLNSKDHKIRSVPGNDAILAQNELTLEQSLVVLAADQDPNRAIALLQAALKKGITGEALNLLRKLHQANPAAAAEMGTEVTSQLMRKGFMSGSQIDYAAVQTAFSFLQEHLRQRPATDKTFRFPAADMRSLADKLVAFVLERGSQSGYPYTQQLIPIAEKMRPDAVEKLNELNQNAPRRGFARVEDPNYRRLMQNETPIEQILAEAPKIPVEMRRSIYHQAANRLAAAGDIARARQILSDNFSDEALVNAQESLNWFQAHQLINQGKFAEAEALIEEFPEGNRFSALISLAETVFNRDRVENKNQALGILSKAGSGIPSRPENNNELQQSVQLIAAYSRIEPSEAFRILEGLVPQINELSEAMMVVNSFNGAYNIRRGESVIAVGGPVGVQVDGSLIRGLAGVDFERTLTLVAGFSRRETRVSLKQQLLESL